LPFSSLDEIISHGSLSIESEDGLYDFIRKGTEMNPEMFYLSEFVRLEYCPTDVMNDLFDPVWESSYEINVSMWATLCARLALPDIHKRPAKQLPRSVKKVSVTNVVFTDKRLVEMDMLDGTITHLMREGCGNLHDRPSSESRVGRSRRRLLGPIHTRGHIITFLIMLQRMELIWKPIHFSLQLIATRKKVFRTRETIGCATISRRGGLCQLTTQSVLPILCSWLI
jgi:hypothetical protein